jgi:hypothetical protein
MCHVTTLRGGNCHETALRVQERELLRFFKKNDLLIFTLRETELSFCARGKIDCTPTFVDDIQAVKKKD